MDAVEIEVDLKALKSERRRQASFARRRPDLLRYQPEYELIRTSHGHWDVFNADTGALAGSAYPTDDGTLVVYDDLADAIACVATVAFIVPTIASHHKRHLRRWEHDFDGDWIRWTQYGELRVTKIGVRDYQVSRNYRSLYDERWRLATFTTLAEAKRAADRHMRQGYPNSDPIPDGLSWPIDPDIDWWRRYN
jgi:hypothetical protein